MSFRILKLSDIEETYQKVASLLDRDVKVIGNRTGWHQYLGESKVGEVATAQGILILFYLSRHHRLLPALLTTLREAQFQGKDIEDRGGWAMLSSHHTPTLEPTAWAILSLLAGKESVHSKTILLGAEWIKRNQNPDGGWGPRKNLRSRLYSTFLACRCISAIESSFSLQDSDYFRNAAQWVLGCQNVDGGWGAYLGETSTAVHTAFALVMLSGLAIDYSARQKIQRGIRFLYKQWNPQTSWEHTQRIEQYELPEGELAWTRVSFQYFPTAWAITALLAAGESIFREPIFSGVKWIIRSQNPDGSWALDGVSRNRLWAVHDAVMAIHSFLNKAISTQTIDRMILLDNVLILTEGHHGRGLARLAFLLSGLLILIGIILGAVLGSATGLHQYVGPWLRMYWAWILLIIYVASVIPLALLKVLSWKEAIIGIIFPISLVIVQVFLKP